VALNRVEESDWTHADGGYLIGNIELLEANTTCHEVLPGAGKPHGEATTKFHARISGGRLQCPPCFKSRIELTFC